MISPLTTVKPLVDMSAAVGDASVTGQSLYSEYARAFRRALLSRDECNNNHDNAKEYLRKVFRDIDIDGDGAVTVDELRQFVKTVKISEDMFDIGDAAMCNQDKFVDILMQQIDINRDGTISYDEMAEFLWPSVESKREIGIVIEIVRQAIKDFLGDELLKRVINWATQAEEVTLITEYARKTGVKLVRGNLLDTRQLRKSLACISNVELVSLSDYEISLLIQTIDTNKDHVMSPKEFKTWLLSGTQCYVLTPLNKEDKSSALDTSVPQRCPPIAEDVSGGRGKKRGDTERVDGKGGGKGGKTESLSRSNPISPPPPPPPPPPPTLQQPREAIYSIQY